MSTPQHADRVDAAIKARARELWKTVEQVAADAGITKQTLRAIRRGENRPSLSTAKGVEDALQVERGSLYDLIDGGELRPLPAPTTLDPYEAQIMDLEDLDIDTRIEIIAGMRADKAAKVAEAKAQAEAAKGRKGRNSA